MSAAGHEGQESRVLAQRIKIGVVLEPRPVPEAVVDRLLQCPNRIIQPAGHRVCAGHVVEHARIVRVKGLRLTVQLHAALEIAVPRVCHRTEIERAGIVRIERQPRLDERDAALCRLVCGVVPA